MSTDIAILDARQMQTTIDYAEKLACSQLIPDDYKGKPANVLWAIEYGRTLGLSTIAIFNGVNVIKGKPTSSAALISGLVRRAGHRMRIGFDRDTMTGWAEIVRSDDPDFTFRCEWDLERAVDAELCRIKDGKPFAVDSKGNTLPWKKFFPSMVKARATTEVARDACEEVLLGLHYTTDELAPEVFVEAGTVQSPPQESVDRRDQVVASAGQHQPQMTRTHTSAPVADQWSTPAPDGVEDAEIVPDRPAESTPDQWAAIGSLFARKYGITKREHKLSVIGQTAGPISSTKELTWDQARGCIGWLEKMDDWAPGEVEQSAIAEFASAIAAAAHMEALTRVGKRINAVRADGPLSEVGLCHVRLAWMDRRAELPQPEPMVDVAGQAPAEAEMAGASA